VCEPRVHDLDRDELAPPICTEEDLAHPTGAEPAEQPIRSDPLRVVFTSGSNAAPR
jgi:hypothetical protein